MNSELDRQIIEALPDYPSFAGIAEIERSIAPPVSRDALRRRLRILLSQGKVETQSARRWMQYRKVQRTTQAAPPEQGQIALSQASRDLLSFLQEPVTTRPVAGYRRGFLDEYQPNKTFYLTAEDRDDLRTIGDPRLPPEPAGTYARKILQRLLIDLSWNSSRLEGNTYSLLDTRRLIDLGERPAGHNLFETQMILNHKEAIELLVNSAGEIGFNRYTIFNLHAILANNLLEDEANAGRLRTVPVGITGSTFHPLEVPQLIEECCDALLTKAASIEDPFEQSFFAMVQLPYLQPFYDVNKRVSRLAANIPFIRRNLVPLSFIDVDRELYTKATLGVYERNDVSLLKDVFFWAYRRSAQRYLAVRQSPGAGPLPAPISFASARHRFSGRPRGSWKEGRRTTDRAMDARQCPAHRSGALPGSRRIGAGEYA